MTTLHIENTVHDFDEWKATFDKFDRVRRDGGVRSYRLSRVHGDESRVLVDLEFDDRPAAEEFRDFLATIRQTPQSQHMLVEQRPPVVLDVVADVSLS